MTERHDAVKTTDPGWRGGWTASGRRRRPTRLRTWAARVLPGGIRERLFLLIALTLLPLLLLQGWIYYQHYATRRNEAVRTELEVAREVAAIFLSHIHGIRRQLDTIGGLILISPPLYQTEYLFADMIAQYPAVRTVNWVSPEGIILMSTLPEGIGRDLSIRPYIQQIMAGRPWAIGDLTQSGAIVDDPTVAMGVAVRDERGELRGMVVASLEPTRLDELALIRSRYADRIWTVFDRRGQLVYQNPPVPLTWEQRTQWRLIDPVLEEALRGRAAAGEIASAIVGDRHFTARVPIDDLGWVAGAASPVGLVMAPIWRGVFQDAGLSLLTAGLAFALAYLIARTLAGPLHRLELEARAMGEGRIKTSGDPLAPTEVRSLRGTVARMAGDLLQRAEALDLAKQEWERTFDALPDLIAIIDSQHRILRANRAMALRLGMTPEQCRGSTCYICVHGLDSPPGFCPHVHTLADGREHSTEVYEERLGGYFLVTCSPLFDRQGRVIGSVHTAHDITARKRMEEVLREEKAISENTIESLPGTFYLFDAQGRLLKWNKNLERVSGYTAEEIAGMHPLDFFVGDDRRHIEEKIQEVFATGQATVEAELTTRDGHKIPYLFMGHRTTIGGVDCLIGTGIDITERKRAEQALRELTATLESKVVQRTAELEHRARQLQRLTQELSQTEDRERRRLAEILHDDLQQQLAAAKFHLGLLNASVQDDAPAQETSARIDEMLKQAIRTTRSLSHELSPALLYRSDLGETLTWLANQIQTKHGLVVRVHADGPIDAQSETLRALLYKAAQEMLFNVVKHAQVERAAVRVRRAGRFVCLVVSDRGRGFDPQHLKAAAGFGLFSIRERVQLLGGRMKIRSTPGKGSTFFIAVPDTEPAGDTNPRVRKGGELIAARQ
jgi:PAS domain S-box-containing protein